MSDFAEKHIRTQKLDALTACWKIEKEKEDEHRTARISLEQKILGLAEIDPEHNGTHRLPHNLVVSCKLNRKWDQEFLRSNYKLWNELPSVNNPFREEFKEDKHKMDALQFIDKDLYDFLQKGLTLTGAKPSFKANNQQKEN